NGDGVINDADTLAIVLNYGLTHPRSGGIHSRAGEPVLKLQPRAASYQPGELVQIDVVLGDENNEVNGFYGVAFDLSLDPAIFEPGTIELINNSSFVGNTNNTLILSKAFESTGKVDGALVRKNQQNTSGYGVIATLQFTAKNNSQQNINTGVTISEYKAVNATGNELVFDVIPEITFDVVSSVAEPNKYFKEFSIYPSPFSHQTIISYSLNNTSQVQLSVLDVLGRTLLQTTSETQSAGKHEMVFSDENTKGVLLVELTVDGNRVVRRMVRMN